VDMAKWGSIGDHVTHMAWRGMLGGMAEAHPTVENFLLFSKKRNRLCLTNWMKGLYES